MTIDRIVFEHSRGVRVLQTVLVPDVSPPGRFMSSPYAPWRAYDKRDRKSWHWEDRIPAVGATILPGSSLELLILAARSQPTGFFHGVRVEYHDDGNRYARIDDRHAFLGVRQARCGDALASSQAEVEHGSS